MVSQRIDLEQPEDVGPGFSSISPAEGAVDRGVWLGLQPR